MQNPSLNRASLHRSNSWPSGHSGGVFVRWKGASRKTQWLNTKVRKHELRYEPAPLVAGPHVASQQFSKAIQQPHILRPPIAVTDNRCGPRFPHCLSGHDSSQHVWMLKCLNYREPTPARPTRQRSIRKADRARHPTNLYERYPQCYISFTVMRNRPQTIALANKFTPLFSC